LESWKELDKAFGKLCSPEQGCPATP